MTRTERQIRRWARVYRVDPEAAIAVAHVEGGIIPGGRAGDSGTSFGPFQLHVHGALPQRFWGNLRAAQAWAWSPAGIRYAVEHMALAGARGLRGAGAIRAIVYRFERPQNPALEVRAAAHYLGHTGVAPAGVAPTIGFKPTTFGGNTSALLSILARGNSQIAGAPLTLKNPRDVLAGLSGGIPATQSPLLGLVPNKTTPSGASSQELLDHLASFRRSLLAA